MNRWRCKSIINHDGIIIVCAFLLFDDLASFVLFKFFFRCLGLLDLWLSSLFRFAFNHLLLCIWNLFLCGFLDFMFILLLVIFLLHILLLLIFNLLFLFFFYFLCMVFFLLVRNLLFWLRLHFNLWPIIWLNLIFSVYISRNIYLRWRFLFSFIFFCLSLLFIHIRQLLFRHFSRIFKIIFLSYFLCLFNRNFMWLLKLSPHSTHRIILWILNEVIDHNSCWIVRPVLNFIFCYLSQPKVIHLSISIENLHRHIRLTHLWNYCSVSSISHVNSTKLRGIASHQRFCSLEWMNMIFKRCHHMVLVELRNPVEKSIQETSWIAVKCLTYTVNWNVVVNELDLIFVSFKWINQEFLLIPTIKISYTRRIRACIQSLTPRNVRFRKWN